MTDHIEAEESLRRELRDAGWDLSAQPVEARPGAWEGAGAHFLCTITAPDCEPLTTFYSVGKGIPVCWAKRKAETAEGWRALRSAFAQARNRVTRGDVRNLSTFGRETLHTEAIRLAVTKHYRPSLVDVVGSLFMDASGFPATFREWCEEWHHGEGSPADALETFRACERIYLWLRKAAGVKRDSWAEMASEI